MLSPITQLLLYHVLDSFHTNISFQWSMYVRVKVNGKWQVHYIGVSFGTEEDTEGFQSFVKIREEFKDDGVTKLLLSYTGKFG